MKNDDAVAKLCIEKIHILYQIFMSVRLNERCAVWTMTRVIINFYLVNLFLVNL